MSSSPTEKIHIAVACNDQYICGLAVLLQSIGEHLEPDYHLVVHLLYSSLSPEALSRLESLAQAQRISLDSILVSHNLLKRSGIDEGLTAGNRTRFFRGSEFYHRLLLPSVLPASLERVIYMDSDMMARRSIAPLWIKPFDGKAALVIQDPILATVADMPYLQELITKPDSRYFNSGLIVFNLDRWRREKLAQRVIRLLDEQRAQVRYPDQDILNIVLQGECQVLDQSWNYSQYLPMSDQAAIIHFTDLKPWSSEHSGYYQEEFDAFLRKTPWQDHKPVRPFFFGLYEFCRRHRFILNVGYRDFLALLLYKSIRPWTWPQTYRSIREKRARTDRPKPSLISGL